MSVVFPPKYIDSSQARDFRDLCKPLIHSTGIESIIYYRIYDNGGYFHFSTDPKINQFLFIDSKGKYIFDAKIMDVIFGNKSISKKRTTLFAEDINHSDFLSPMFEAFNIKSAVNILERFEDYYDGFFFTTKPGKTMYGFYVNHFGMLENFILYFREQAHDLISNGEKNKIVWVNRYPEYQNLVRSMQGEVVEDSADVNNLKNTLKLKKYLIKNNQIKTYISLSELRCLQYLGQGFSHKETSNILNISPRTIGSHLQNVKSKLGVSTVSQALKIYHANKLITL
ncbi:MAG: helix-turn-helix transcriptional regulator [Gammaproteobacteria bacterium]|nr:helix-turn-helix transcriptional regulator [Gammaproteobacteria bacterium]